MKVILLLVGLLLIAGGAAARTNSNADGKFGVGFELGEPTSINVKYIQDATYAYDGAISFTYNDYIVLYGDILMQFPKLIPRTNEFFDRLTPYMGAGPVLVVASNSDHPKGEYYDKRSDSLAIGARVPFGIEWMWDRVPLGIGLELAPGIIILPGTVGMVQGGLTIRYYF